MKKSELLSQVRSLIVLLETLLAGEELPEERREEVEAALKELLELERELESAKPGKGKAVKNNELTKKDRARMWSVVSRVARWILISMNAS